MSDTQERSLAAHCRACRGVTTWTQRNTIRNTVRASVDFPGETPGSSRGQTLTFDGPPELVPAWSCSRCGRAISGVLKKSRTREDLVEQLVREGRPAQAAAFSGTGEDGIIPRELSAEMTGRQPAQTPVDQEIEDGWNNLDGQGNRAARQRGDGCVVVECRTLWLALELTRLFYLEFAILSCCHWDRETLSMYCGDAGSGGVYLRPRIEAMARATLSFNKQHTARSTVGPSEPADMLGGIPVRWIGVAPDLEGAPDNTVFMVTLRRGPGALGGGWCVTDSPDPAFPSTPEADRGREIIRLKSTLRYVRTSLEGFADNAERFGSTIGPSAETYREEVAKINEVLGVNPLLDMLKDLPATPPEDGDAGEHYVDEIATGDGVPVDAHRLVCPCGNAVILNILGGDRLDITNAHGWSFPPVRCPSCSAVQKDR